MVIVVSSIAGRGEDGIHSELELELPGELDLLRDKCHGIVCSIEIETTYPAEYIGGSFLSYELPTPVLTLLEWISC